MMGGQSFNPDSTLYVARLYEIFRDELSEDRMTHDEKDIAGIENALREGL
jgi:hypothetical protein